MSPNGLKLKKNETIKTFSSAETEELGFELGALLPKNSVICFFGELGAGKTTLIKGIAKKVGEIPSEKVTSPTFVYLNIYNDEDNVLTKPVFHFDLYRLSNADEFLHMGFEEYFSADGICLIEWSERIEDILPQSRICITLNHAGENCRIIEIVQK